MQGCGTRHGAWSFHDSMELLTYLLLCRCESAVSEGSMEAVPFKVRSASQVVGWSDMRFNQIEFPNQLSAQETSATASFFSPEILGSEC